MCVFAPVLAEYPDHFVLRVLSGGYPHQEVAIPLAGYELVEFPVEVADNGCQGWELAGDTRKQAVLLVDPQVPFKFPDHGPSEPLSGSDSDASCNKQPTSETESNNKQPNSRKTPHSKEATSSNNSDSSDNNVLSKESLWDSEQPNKEMAQLQSNTSEQSGSESPPPEYQQSQASLADLYEAVPEHLLVVGAFIVFETKYCRGTGIILQRSDKLQKVKVERLVEVCPGKWKTFKYRKHWRFVDGCTAFRFEWVDFGKIFKVGKFQ